MVVMCEGKYRDAAIMIMLRKRKRKESIHRALAYKIKLYGYEERKGRPSTSPLDSTGRKIV